MHNDTILQIVATAVASKEQEPQANKPVLKNRLHPNAGGSVLAFPPNRNRIVADLGEINRQFFLMICDVQRGMLVHLSHIPCKLLVAAEKLVKPQDMEGWSEPWSRTLVLYLEAIKDGRQQILTTTRLHGTGACALETAVAINEVEKAVSTFLRALSEVSTHPEVLTGAAKDLGAAAMALDKILTELLETVELSIKRAKADGVTKQTDFGPRIS